MQRNEYVYIVMPAYNERENIQRTVDEWLEAIRPFGTSAKLLIIDDGSTDGTEEVLQSLSTVHPELLVVRKENSGHGPTVSLGYRLALDDGAEFIFQTDSDGQTSPEDFKTYCVPFLENEKSGNRSSLNAIFGNRAERGDGKGRAFTEKVLCRMVKLFFGVSVPDSNAPFRLYRAEVLAKYLPLVPRSYELPNVLLTALFAKYDICEFDPITFAPRRAGRNSVNWKRIFRTGLRAVRDFAGFRKTIFASPPGTASTRTDGADSAHGA